MTHNPNIAIIVNWRRAGMEVRPRYPLQQARLKDLAAYLSADWLISTLTTLMEHAALDGRIHSFVTIGTDTGRRASSHPQVQNWKIPAMAGVATGDEGFMLVELDMSNAENVMAAFISGDSALAAAYNTDDFHSAMTVQYFGEKWEQAVPEEHKHLRNLRNKFANSRTS